MKELQRSQLDYNLQQFPLTSPIHLLTPFPKPINKTFEILGPFQPLAWIWILNGLFLLTLSMLLVMKTYVYYRSDRCINDPLLVIVHILGGLTQPPAASDFFPRGGISGGCVTLMISVLVYYFDTMYNSDLRSYIIGEIMEPMPRFVEDLNWRTDDVIITLGAQEWIVERRNLQSMWRMRANVSMGCSYKGRVLDSTWNWYTRSIPIKCV